MTPTPEERAESVCIDHCLRTDHHEQSPTECAMRDSIAAAIRSAEEAEREACAEVAGTFGLDQFNNRQADDETAEGIAAAIRARGGRA